MAVVIASNLRKELAGSVLFDGVSFSVERRDRVALSGPNGAGKTTLLRILSGETEKHGGELAFQKGTRVALHDQRPPLERDLTLREYVLSGARDLVAPRGGARAARAGDGARRARPGDDEPLRRGAGAARARRRLRLARPRDAGACAGSASPTRDLDRPLRTFSGGELTRASLARALGGDPDLLLLDEPTNHLDVASLEWLERELQSLDAGVILVAHDRWFLEAVTTATLELGARPRRRSSPGPGTRGGARRRRALLHAQKEVDARAGRHRAARALRRALPLQEVQGQAGAGEADADRPAREGAQQRDRRDRAALAPHAHARLRVPEAARAADAPSSRRTRLDVADRRASSCCADASFALERGEHVALVGPNGSGKTTLLETMLGRREPQAAGAIRLGHGVEAAYFSQQEVELDERGSVLAVRAVDDGAARGPTRRACSASSSSPAGTSTRSR